MIYWIRRGWLPFWQPARCLRAGGGYLYCQLPDTFLVEQGQTLRFAQMPWLQPLQQSGAAQAGSAPAGGSYNVTPAFGAFRSKRCVRLRWISVR